MSSIYSYTVSPASLHGKLEDRDTVPHHVDTHEHLNYKHQTVPVDHHQLLSPHSSHIRSNSASPAGGSSNTPADSSSALSAYQSSDLSEPEDPFWGVSFDEAGLGTPAFLDDQSSEFIPGSQTWDQDEHRESSHAHSEPTSPQDLTLLDSIVTEPQLTPDTNEGSWPGDDKLLSNRAAMTSPRVMVSVWGNTGEDPVHRVETTFAQTPGTDSLRFPGLNIDDSLSVDTVHGSVPSVSRDTLGNWPVDARMGRRGVGPEERSTGETTSVNELAASKQMETKNQEVAAWVSDATEKTNDLPVGGIEAIDPRAMHNDSISDQDVPLGHTTENKYVPNQVYYNIGPNTGPAADAGMRGFDPNDLDMLPSRNWGDAPMLHQISRIDSLRRQPESSQAAIARFERMCQDNASIVSHAATWGTRRRSLPSIMDTEGVLSGNIFKKLSLKGDHSTRRASLLKRIPSMVRRPSASQLLKRKGSNADEVASDESESNGRRESRDSLAPPSRSPSWGIKKKEMPSLNTAIVGIAAGAASIGAAHAGNGSISATSPKPSFGLAPVKHTLIRRPRSRTDISKSDSSFSNIVGMLKKAGGPPVAQLAKSQVADMDDDDDEDDEDYDEVDNRDESTQVEDIIPTFDGFRQHIVRLNPALAETTSSYLVDRIAHQMVIRYKHLQNQKIKHLQAANFGRCSSGTFCVHQGGAALTLDTRGDARGVDPLSGRPDSSDGDTTPLEGQINNESFPIGIPMPPTHVLPAEFECQLCFSSRKFIKPSDWTKHVHEDVQPFTCTWDKCRDPKMFKRKADWVRHENEGHRHLEWWTCDVDECQHMCYRRDNFLQHLVREHKFAEPKVKTKAAIKKAGGLDPTWQKVEQCHKETKVHPSDEPCRFCRKTFPTWKKLTVHLAKHMEHISLPVVRLVAAKDLKEDTVISPVQDPPPRSFGGLATPIKQEAPFYSPGRPHALSNPSPVEFGSHSPYGFQHMPHNQMQPQFYNAPPSNPRFDGMTQDPASNLMIPQVTAGFSTSPQYHSLPVTTGAAYGQTGNAYMPMQSQLEPFPSFGNPLGLHDSSGVQMPYDALGNPLQNMDAYSNPGSISPYSRSPHQGHANFYPQ